MLSCAAQVECSPSPDLVAEHSTNTPVYVLVAVLFFFVCLLIALVATFYYLNAKRLRSKGEIMTQVGRPIC